jgi:hypothetical protein
VLEGGWGNAKEDMAGGGRDRGKGSDAAALPEDTESSRANVVVKQESDEVRCTFVNVEVEEDPGSSSEVVGIMADEDKGSSEKLDIEKEENGRSSRGKG